MSDKQRLHGTLQDWLSITRKEEIDCDRFAELLAPWLDQRIVDPRIKELLEHHRRLCSECDEEASQLEAALAEAK
jgi:hypothetical protein